MARRVVVYGDTVEQQHLVLGLGFVLVSLLVPVFVPVLVPVLVSLLVPVLVLVLGLGGGGELGRLSLAQWCGP